MENDPTTEFRRLFWRARKAHRSSETEDGANHPDHEAALTFATTHGWTWAELLVKASRLDAVGEHDEALSLLDECERLVPDKEHGFVHYIRGSVLGGLGLFDEAIETERKALDNPGFDKPGYAWLGIGIALGEQGRHDRAIEAYKEALDNPSYDKPSHAWLNVGVALHEQGEYDKAVEAYHKALDDPNYDKPGTAWNNIGIVLRNQGRYDEAIEAYHKALDDPNYDKPGIIWNNLGCVLHEEGRYDEAVEAYNKALDAPDFDKPGIIWNNLGIALDEQDRLDEAIKAYHKALDAPNYGTPAKVWVNLAQTYVETGKHDEAEVAFKEALSREDPSGSDHARARLGLQMLEADMEEEALSPDDRAMAEEISTMAEKTSTDTPTEEIEASIIAAIQDAGNTQYEKYIEIPDSGRDNTLSILRGWSSAVTLLEGSERRWRGGGYFLKWRGYGVVIDPGFDFLRNFHDAGYHGREIHAVVVSHNHPDHNSDVKDINDLRYELYKRLASREESAVTPYVLMWDQDTAGATSFAFERPKHQHRPVVLASGFPQPINLMKHPSHLPIRVVPFKVNHGGDVPNAMGMVIELLGDDGEPEVRIGYTGDTAYFDGLSQYFDGCDMLIAHISQPSIKELQDASEQKDVHLGYRGTIKLLSECEPRLALIGEFWAGFTDLRIPLIKGLRQRSGQSAVLPAGLDMHICLSSLDIECTECGELTAFSDIKIAPPTDNFSSLAYLCPDCMIG
jgi:tetratricopeptide (TPR) repeat protein/ribonuclease BN (tRNA processing enzyme)